MPWPNSLGKPTEYFLTGEGRTIRDCAKCTARVALAERDVSYRTKRTKSKWFPKGWADTGAASKHCGLFCICAAPPLSAYRTERANRETEDINPRRQKLTMGKRTVKNYPSPRLMETIGATNQKPSEAIGELVANCFDARVGTEKMRIVVDMRGGKITVTDNGKGMTGTVLEKAVCIAEDMSQYIERGEGAKGHFGMGFKTSCSTLGGFYEIFTRPVDESIEYHVAFDISDYSKRPSGEDAWDVVIEDSPVDQYGPLGDALHGTSFVVSRLKDKNITVSAVLDYLGEAFKGHLETGDSIILVDSTGSRPAVPKKYDFLEGTKIDIDTACGPNDDFHITGWMALDKQTHNDGLYGFNIYRNKQLVMKWDKSWFRAHLMTSRIIGEVNLDFLDATFYKQGLQQDETWAIVNAHMKEYLKAIVTASNKVSKKGNINKPSELKKIVGDLRESYDEDPMPGLYSGKGDNGGGSKNDEKKSVKDTIRTIVKERSLILKDEGEIEISYLEKSGGKKKAPFDYIYDESDEDGAPGKLQVIVFTDHPIWGKKDDHEVIKVLATSDSIYRLLIEELSYDAYEARSIRDEWVWKRTAKEEASDE